MHRPRILRSLNASGKGRRCVIFPLLTTTVGRKSQATCCMPNLTISSKRMHSCCPRFVPHGRQRNPSFVEHHNATRSSFIIRRAMYAPSIDHRVHGEDVDYGMGRVLDAWGRDGGSAGAGGGWRRCRAVSGNIRRPRKMPHALVARVRVTFFQKPRASPNTKCHFKADGRTQMPLIVIVTPTRYDESLSPTPAL